MAFLGDLVVKIRGDANPFTAALKKAQTMTRTFKSSLDDMRTTAGVFARLAASIKAVNVQMDRLIHVSKGALNAVNNQATAENHQFKIRMQQLKMMAEAQRFANQQQGGGGSMLGAGMAGGIAGAVASGVMGMASSAVGGIIDLGIGIVKLGAEAEVMRAEFGVLLGDVGKGAAMFSQLEKFAARTSFDLESAAHAMRSLLAAGVKQDSLLDTMQLLGDLSLGDANKLQFLSKAYTDVFNKGRLQGQEIKQFAENGVGLLQALATTLKVPAGEILKMSENGQISFNMMQDALKSLTAEGGRFFGAMEARNKTFKGQWDSLIENIQAFGRDLGALVLPALKNVVTEMNAFVQKFRGLDGKAQFLADLFDASLSVAFELIKENFSSMLNHMMDEAMKAGPQIAKNLTGVALAEKAFRAGEHVGGVLDQNGGLEGAKARLNDVLGRLGPDDQGIIRGGAPAMDNKRGRPIADGSGVAALAGGLADGAMSLFERASIAATGKMTDLKIKGEYLGSIVKNMFGVGPASGKDVEKAKAKDGEKAKDTSVQLAGAMQRGSQEAYSTIVRSMNQGKDKNVQATEKQTGVLVKAIKGNKPQQFNMVGAFA